MIMFSMYIYYVFQCKGISKLLLRLSTLTYYKKKNVFCLYHVLYMSVLKAMYYVHV